MVCACRPTTGGQLLIIVLYLSSVLSQQQLVDPYDMLGERKLKKWDELPAPSGGKLLPQIGEASSLTPGRSSSLSRLQEEAVNTEGFFMRRFVRMLLKQLSFENGGEQLYELTVVLSQQHLDALHNFAKANVGMDGIQEASSALEHIIAAIEPMSRNQDTLNWPASYHSKATFVTQVLCCTAASVFIMFCTVKVWSRLHWRILLIIPLAFFLISIPWTWVHLYKKNLAERMNRLDTGKPKECDPSKMSFVTALYNRNGEKCAQYYSDLLIDPLWEVKPTEVLAETIVELIWKPLEKMGKPLGIFLNEVTVNVAWYMRPLVFFGGLLSLGFFVIVISKYTIRVTPWIAFEPSSSDYSVVREAAADHAEIRSLRDAVEQTKESISQLAIRSAGIEEIKTSVLKLGDVLTLSAAGDVEQLGRRAEPVDGRKSRCEVVTIGCASITAAETVIEHPYKAQQT